MKRLPTMLWAMLFGLIATVTSSAQNPADSQHETQFNSIEASSPFTRKKDTKRISKSLLAQKVYLEIDKSYNKSILKSRDEKVVMNLPFEEGTESLLLTKANITTPEFKVYYASNMDQPVDIEIGEFYWGKVKGDDNSLVVLSISNEEISGLISTKSKNYTLSKMNNDPYHILYQETDLSNLPVGTCHAEEISGQVQSKYDRQTKAAQNTNNEVKMHIEADHSIYQQKGTETASYIASIFNQVAILYANEAINISLNHLVIWDTPDPYTGSTAYAKLDAFRIYQNGTYNGDLAHLISLNSLDGAAYLNTLCKSPFGVGFSGINTFYRNVPTYSWTVNVITHEIGHNLGSYHTHDCVWNGNNTAIDGCGPAAGFNSSCNGPIPEAGTIMSYCHLASKIDLNLGFGEQPGNLIRDKVYGSICLTEANTTEECAIGSPCDDKDPCTTQDVYLENCNCQGQYTDADGDGYCVGEDANDNNKCIPDNSASECNTDNNEEDPTDNCVIDEQSFESSMGIWKDGGADCSLTARNASTGINSIKLRDNSGMSSSLYSKNINFSAVSDLQIDFSFYTSNLAKGEDFFIEISVDGGVHFIYEKKYIAQTDFENRRRYYESAKFNNLSLSANTVIRFRCDASSNNDVVYLDDVKIRTCGFTSDAARCDDGKQNGDEKGIDCGGAQCIPCETCDDGIRNGYETGIDCGGHECAPCGSSCDDGIRNGLETGIDCGGPECSPCETCNDGIQNGYETGIDCGGPNCGECVSDGECIDCEVDESPCGGLFNSKFESGWGIWNDGGTDCALLTENAIDGEYSVRLRDNSKQSSSLYTNIMDFSSHATLSIDFLYYPEGMEADEDFLLEVSYNGGQSYRVIKSWVSGIDFRNGETYVESVPLMETSATMVIRFRVDASANSDRIYLDNIRISSCEAGLPGIASSKQYTKTATHHIHDNAIAHEEEENRIDNKETRVYPNPVSDLLHIDLNIVPEHKVSLELYSQTGQLLTSTMVDAYSDDISKMDVSKIQSGLYLLMIRSEGKTLDLKKVSIVR